MRNANQGCNFTQVEKIPWQSLATKAQPEFPDLHTLLYRPSIVFTHPTAPLERRSKLPRYPHLSDHCSIAHVFLPKGPVINYGRETTKWENHRSKTFCFPSSREGKTFCPPPPPSVWLKLQDPVLKLPQNLVCPLISTDKTCSAPPPFGRVKSSLAPPIPILSDHSLPPTIVHDGLHVVLVQKGTETKFSGLEFNPASLFMFISCSPYFWTGVNVLSATV